MKKLWLWGGIGLGSLLIVLAGISPAVGETDKLGGTERPVMAAETPSFGTEDWVGPIETPSFGAWTLDTGVLHRSQEPLRPSRGAFPSSFRTG